MTPKQIKFCQEYLVDLNATQAAIRAGYSKKTAFMTGHENLRKPNIEAEIARNQKKLQEKTQITAEYVVKSLKTVAERCMQAEEVLCRDSNGEMMGTGEYKFDSSGANRSLELLGKHIGMFKDVIVNENKFINSEVEELDETGFLEKYDCQDIMLESTSGTAESVN
jgi:phage terminase small subunit